MIPYKFTSNTHSLSTEELGKFFIDCLIHPSTLQEPFTLNRKTPVNGEKLLENWKKISGR